MSAPAPLTALAAPRADRARVLGRMEALSRVGRLANGGLCRLALSDEETEARRMLIGWAQALGCTATLDPAGNLFLRMEGRRPDLAPLLVGSHLDSQPVGGHFDGVLGVVAGLECLELLVEAGGPERPVELVSWCNEEGVRFAPTTMGSAVHAGALPLARALATRDAEGTSLAAALERSAARLRAAGLTLTPRGLGGSYSAFVELHIEQGPVLEREGIAIGVVSDVQGLAQFRLSVAGTAGHAGAVPMAGREDALTRARAVMDRLDACLGALPGLRHTIGRIEVSPGAINTIPARVDFTLDARHPDPEVLARAIACVTAAEAEVTPLIHQAPVPFSPALRGSIAAACDALGLSRREMISGATHDAAQAAALCPAGMIFVPCSGGISHNENEHCPPEAVMNGTDVLAGTVFALAGKDPA
ncbi:M20 family metallo-hydrolase [Oceanicella sp. SM1341]|uniref:M20 family metallo-hydrolase n=1 Tax=Oceanicella sp. SM1341 TaxID=1548889 RepID=UPI000E551396|nr:M20 family metallo-hydrolase [Oceanicella sp. SM1341]